MDLGLGVCGLERRRRLGLLGLLLSAAGSRTHLSHHGRLDLRAPWQNCVTTCASRTQNCTRHEPRNLDSPDMMDEICKGGGRINIFMEHPPITAADFHDIESISSRRRLFMVVSSFPRKGAARSPAPPVLDLRARLGGRDSGGPGAGWSEVLRQCGHRLRAAAVLVAVLPDPPPRLAAHPGEKEMKMDPS